LVTQCTSFILADVNCHWLMEGTLSGESMDVDF